MTVSRLVRRAILAGAALVAAPCVSAGYFQWDMVELPASSGASCGNGTPYRFFVNRTPFTRNLAIVYEGGGACWDQAACEGVGLLRAANPNGIGTDYMQSLTTTAIGGLVTPFSSRLNPFQQVQTQSWNIAYLPYCTGDVHSGSKVTVYDDANPAAPRTQYHRGYANIQAATAWMKRNLQRPGDLLLTGFSAGSVGATTTYDTVRTGLAPTGRVSLIADSGLLMQAPRGSSPVQFPSILLHETIRTAWGLDSPQGLLTAYASTLPAFDPNNLGSVNGALALRYPQDRFTFLAFRADMNFSLFSYAKFFPDIATAPSQNELVLRTLSRWQPDLFVHAQSVSPYANVSFHHAYFRDFNDSHCLTVIDFSATGIEEAGIPSIAPVVAGTLNRGPVSRAIEMDAVSDFSRPVSWAIQLFKWLQTLI